MKLRARWVKGTWGPYIDLTSLNGIFILCWYSRSFARHWPGLAKKIKAAKGKSVIVKMAIEANDK